MTERIDLDEDRKTEFVDDIAGILQKYSANGTVDLTVRQQAANLFWDTTTQPPPTRRTATFTGVPTSFHRRPPDPDR